MILKQALPNVFENLKETQTISIYWFYLLQNHVDMSTKSK